MTMNEKRLNACKKEVEKLEKSLTRYQGIYEKKLLKCEKADCNWTDEEARANYTDERWSLWFEASIAKDSVEDTKKKLNRAKENLAKAESNLDSQLKLIEATNEFTAKTSKIESYWVEYFSKTPEQRKAEYEAWLKRFKADCLKDGIIIKEASSNWISGQTKSGKAFWMSINSGYTSRSLHCYSLRIDKQTIFTSGTFETAYEIISK